MHQCRQCAYGLEDEFRFCPWCSAPQRRKLVEFFPPHPDLPQDADKALRVSRYFAAERPAHVRLSIWQGEEAAAAMSLSEDEAGRLAAFLAPPGPPRRALIEHLRDSLRV